MRARLIKLISAGGVGLTTLWLLASCGEASRTTIDPELVHTRTRFMPGLDAHFTFVKTPNDAFAVDAAGVLHSIVDVQRADAAARVRTHGRTSPELQAAVSRAAADDVLRVAVWFHQQSDGLSASAHAPLAHDEEKRATLERRLKSLLPDWEQSGFSLSRSSTYIPAAFGTVPASMARRLSQSNGVSLVTLAEPSKKIMAAAPNTMTDPQTDVVNDLGYYGSGQRVGYAEAAECGVYDGHESQADQPPIYSDPVPSCSSSCSQPGCICVDGSCVGDHQAQVVSAIRSKKDGDPYGASDAELYQYNGSEFACDPAEMDNVYTWFATNAVESVAQSWYCHGGDFVPTTDTDGVVQDAYVRGEGISIFKAAGNQDSGSLETACASTLNSVCVGGSEDGGTALASFSSWVNLEDFDREEPDLVALAVDTEVMGFGGFDDWDTNSGTSFAAPAVTAISALMKEACAGSLDDNPLGVRVLMELASAFRNPHSWKYSTPGKEAAPTFPRDFRDGAGAILTPPALDPCVAVPGEDGWDDVTWGNVNIDLTAGGDPPSGDSPPSTDPPPGDTSSIDIAAVDVDAEDGARTVQPLFTFGGANLPSETRIRAVIAWNSCPGADPVNTPGPTAISTDFDLFLYNEDTGDYVFTSQSFDDNKEGFDVIISSSGHHTVYVSWLDGAIGCDFVGSEPLAFGVGYFTP